MDIEWIPDVNRDNRLYTDSRIVLPANERSQLRWNLDPHDVDGGSGGSEAEPGAFLYSYWAARYAGLLVAPAR